MKNNKGFASVGIIIAIIAVLVVGGVVYLFLSGQIRPDFDNGLNSNLAVQIPKDNNISGELGDDINGKHIGYINSITSQGGTNSLVIDYVEWITNCQADAQTSYCMNGYDVVNNNAQLRTFVVSNNAQVTLQTYSHQTSGLDAGNFNYNEIVSLPIFINAINNPSVTYPAQNLLYWITLSNGEVTKITEQYQP